MQAFYLKRLQGIPLGNNSGFGAKSSTRSAGFQAERRNRKRYPRNIPYIPAVATHHKKLDQAGSPDYRGTSRSALALHLIECLAAASQHLTDPNLYLPHPFGIKLKTRIG